MHPTQSAIIKTLCYADIFNFPLKLPEIHQKLIYSHPTSVNQVNYHLKRLVQNSVIHHQDSFYFLPGRIKNINSRTRRSTISAHKLTYVRNIITRLNQLPFIQAVFLTGTVAVANATLQDDIDIAVITSPNSLYTGRFMVSLWLEIHHLRRRPKDHQVANKICPNLFLTTTSLAVPLEQQNLYTAHEVIQTVALIDPNNYYQKFLRANSWILRYLPNSNQSIGIKSKQQRQVKSAPPLLETVMRIIQLIYMYPKRTIEIITPHIAYFHPRDTAGIILNRYNKSLSRYL